MFTEALRVNLLVCGHFSWMNNQGISNQWMPMIEGDKRFTSQQFND